MAGASTIPLCMGGWYYLTFLVYNICNFREKKKKKKENFFFSDKKKIIDSWLIN